MWGVCLDNQAMDVGLFRAVIRYEIDHLNNTVVEALARVLLPEIQAFFESKDGRREYAEWKAKQQTEQKNKV